MVKLARLSIVVAVVGLAGLAATGAALAADMRVKAPTYKAPPPVAVVSWTGCYVGGNAGWIGGRDKYDLNPSGDFLDPGNIFSNPANNAVLSHSYRSRSSGIEGGVQIGCNYQTGAWVWGVEADFNGSGLRESITSAYGPAGPLVGVGGARTSSHTETVTKDLHWFSTLRGRLGFTWDRLWIYGTGGLAVARIKSTTSLAFADDQFFLGNFVFAGSTSVTRIGYAVGAGAEYAFTDNWSLKVEYLYLDFGRFSYDSACLAPAVSCGGGATPFTWTTNLRARENVVRAGLNYRFGYAPVIAKY